MRLVLDREVEGSNLSAAGSHQFFTTGPIDFWWKGDRKRKKEMDSRNLILIFEFEFEWFILRETHAHF